LEAVAPPRAARALERRVPKTGAQQFGRPTLVREFEAKLGHGNKAFRRPQRRGRTIICPYHTACAIGGPSPRREERGGETGGQPAALN